MSIDKIVNANENQIARRLYLKRLENGENSEHLMKHIPAARMLIKKFSQEAWKNSVNHFDYAFKEYQLCSMIEDIERYPREGFIRLIAILLDCSPVQLHNDAELPF